MRLNRNISRRNVSKNEVPRRLLTDSLETIQNQTLTTRDPKMDVKYYLLFDVQSCLVAVQSFGNEPC